LPVSRLTRSIPTSWLPEISPCVLIPGQSTRSRGSTGYLDVHSRERLRFSSASNSAASLMLRIASAKSDPAGSDECDRLTCFCSKRGDRICRIGCAFGVRAAGKRATNALTLRSGMPRRRAWTDASTRAPSDKRPPGSGASTRPRPLGASSDSLEGPHE
jgi:hypothetical protein